MKSWALRIVVVLAVLWTAREAVVMFYFVECMSSAGDNPISCSSILHGWGG